MKPMNLEPDCFQLISQADLEALAENRTQLTYLKGETIFKQGAFAPHVLFIQSGLVRVYLQAGMKKVQNLWVARTGEFLAFSTLFGQKTYAYSAAAMKDAQLLMIDKESLRKLLQANPEFAFRITSRNFSSEHQLIKLVASLSHKQMRGKLATSLIYLSEENFAREDIFRYLTRQDLADFASISAESVVKFLKEFEKEGILELDSKDIRILDMERLERISEKG